MGLLDTIKKAFQLMPELASAVGSLALTVVILATVLGVFIYQVVTAGNVNVDTISSNVVSEQSANLTTTVADVWAAATSVGGFIVLAVIAIIAVGILGKKFLGGGRM